MENGKRFEGLRYVLRSDGRSLKDSNNRMKNPEQFAKQCFNARIAIDFSKLNDEYKACVEELYEEEYEKSPEQQVLENLNSEEIFKDFELIVDGKGAPIVKYISPDSGRKNILGTTKDVDFRYLYKELVGSGISTIDKWKFILKPYLKPLKITNLTAEVAVETIWARLYSGLELINRQYVDPDAMPVALQGKGRPADHIIPFNPKDVTLGDLHPFLRGFLERTEDHKYLCAMLASRLLGFKHAYIPYLVGAGGDGKSTFISFLDRVVDGYTATLDLADSTYGLYNCIDKIFLFVNDTSNKRIFYYETIKNISGNDFTRVNGKYQHARDVKLPGMILISSNQMPILTKAEWLKRRARIFQVAPMTREQKENLVDVGTAVNLMAQTSNEFINYCLQCLGQVGNPETGEVKLPPTHSELIEGGETPEEDEFEDFLLDLGMELTNGSKTTEYSFRKKIRIKVQEQHKSEYFMQNFLAYLREKKGITRSGGYYHNIGLPGVKMDGHTKFAGKTAS